MKRYFVLIAAIVLVAVLAVSVSLLGMPGRDYENTSVTMSRGVCFGTCPVYTVTVYGNGSVFYEGRMFVEKEGNYSYQIPAEDARELIDEFYIINFFGLKDEYTEPVTDLPTTVVSIKVSGQEKKVIDYYGAPDKLRELEMKIDETARIEQYAGSFNL